MTLDMEELERMLTLARGIRNGTIKPINRAQYEWAKELELASAYGGSDREFKTNRFISKLASEK